MTDSAVERFTRLSGRVAADPSHRSETQRDRDRILYSEAFRRLGGVTQVATGTPGMMLHNRLTHSLKVEQVGIALFTKLASDNPELATKADQSAVAAACLAHDVGHPPFGHAGEQELHALVTCTDHRMKPRTLAQRVADPCEVCPLEDGFEGNAQSFRLLSVLSVRWNPGKSDEIYGLDLTRATLRAASKYPWARGDNIAKPRKWGAYDCDLPILKRLTNGNPALTLDAQIMDWADDISYAVHDVEDFYRAGYIPVDQLKAGENALVEFLQYVESPNVLGVLPEDVRTTLENLLAYFPTRRFAGRASDFEELDRTRGTLLTRFIDGASVVGDQLKVDPLQKSLNAIVQQLIWYHVIDDPRLSNIQAGQRRVLREIFEALLAPADHAFKVGADGEPDEKDLRRLPHELRRSIQVSMAQDSSYTRKQRVRRGLLDYISSLSDADAYHQHAVLKGREPVGHL